MTQQVKSKQRVAEHGEVFTAEREVKAMCDLVKQETERIDSRFLEPACGDGNFLSEILSRKLTIVKKKYKRLPLDYEKNAILALSSIYGVDIMLDNAIACRERLFAIWDKEYRAICKKECREDTREAARFILSRNIVCGNALTLMCVDENGNDTAEPIVFSEWAFITSTQLQRKDYTFDELLNGDDASKKKRQKKEQLTLFDEPQADEEGKFLKQYISDYRRVQDNG
ncbi:restriction endonuclease subunit M [Dehalococcoides sp. THU4]|uniref:restriction endonuclease subunit M n=1 Tax=Dehalococcoides sp. THU4 TaxID=3348344 RepID=UPI003719B54A